MSLDSYSTLFGHCATPNVKEEINPWERLDEVKKEEFYKDGIEDDYKLNNRGLLVAHSQKDLPRPTNNYGYRSAHNRYYVIVDTLDNCVFYTDTKENPYEQERKWKKALKEIVAERGSMETVWAFRVAKVPSVYVNVVVK